MAHKIIGDLSSISADIAGNPATITINGELPDTSGNVNIEANTIIEGTDGMSIIFNEDNVSVIDTTAKIARIIETDEELEQSKNRIISFSEVFNSWYRFSHYESDGFPAVSSELNAWIYNSSLDSVVTTQNTLSYIGLVSPDSYDNYTFHVNVRSTDTDDDVISVVLAFKRIQDKEYTISAIRTGRNIQTNPGADYVYNYGWALVYNAGQTDEWAINDGTLVTPLVTGDWSSFPNGANILCERDGNIITASTTQLGGDLNTYISELQIDLGTDPRLEKFINPSQIGYGAQSQTNSSYRTLLFSRGTNVIYDSRNGDVWRYSSSLSDWELISSLNMYTELKKGYLYGNPETGKLFSINQDNTTDCLSGHSIGNGPTQLPNNALFGFSRSSQFVGSQSLPSGLIMQWVTGTTDSTGKGTFTLPQPLSTGILAATAEIFVFGTLSSGHTYSFAWNKAESTNTTVVFNTKSILSNGVGTSSSVIAMKALIIGY